MLDAKSKWTYIAGFFDGEGSVVVSRYKTKKISLDITNSDLEVLEWIQKVSSMGKIYEDNRDLSLGGTSKSYKYRVFRQADTSKFLTKMYPFLKIKKPIAKMGLQYLSSRMDNPPNKAWHRHSTKEETLWTKMRKFNADRSGHARASRNYFHVPEE